jgi:hypothetical protein
MMHIVKTAVLALLLAGIAGVAAAGPPPEQAAVAPASAPKKLDLRAPDVTQLFSAEQLNRIFDRTRGENIAEVEVEGARDKVPPPSSPYVWPTIAAPIWALLHPLQAWRIIAPIPHDRARLMAGGPPDFTTGYLEPAAVVQPSY